jgi:general secretion pathway protein N
MAKPWLFGRPASAALPKPGSPSRGRAGSASRPAASGPRRWALVGALAGGLLALAVFAPAAWVAGALARATAGQLLLAESRGTWWSGDAVVVLSGGPGSRDAWTLPGRVSWSLRLQGLQPLLSLRQPCCLIGETTLRLEPGIGRLGIALLPQPPGTMNAMQANPAAPQTAPRSAPRPATPQGLVGQWPASWLTALGTPWNTLKPAGLVRLSAQQWRVDFAEGRWRMAGSLAADFVAISSSLSTLPSLGSYRVEVSGDAGGAATLALRTVEGPLMLTGQGQWTGGRLRLRGEARAASGHEASLNNLLNLIGRRQGDRALIAIG